MNRILPILIYSFLVITALSVPVQIQAQIKVTGTVYDSARTNFIEGAKIFSTKELIGITDSLGHYTVWIQPGDSLYFSFRNKPTLRYAVNKMEDPSHFDISLHINVKSRYKPMQEVVVYGKNHRQDSLENRMAYQKEFDYEKPGLKTSMSDGAVGFDINELINVFRFRRNKNLRKFHNRLLLDEQEKYISYRFSKEKVRRITNLPSPQIDTFLIRYRPDYQFCKQADELLFNEYIIRAWYHFTGELEQKPAATLPVDNTKGNN